MVSQQDAPIPGVNKFELILGAKITQLIQGPKEISTSCNKDGSGFLEKEELHKAAVEYHAKVTEGKDNAKPFNEKKFEKDFEKLKKNTDGKITIDQASKTLVK